MKKLILLNMLLLIVLAQSMLLAPAITNETQNKNIANQENTAISVTSSVSSLTAINSPTTTLVTGNSTASWQELGPNSLANGNNVFTWGKAPFSGRVTAIVINGSNSQEIYVGTAQGGVWKTLNGGQSWTSLMDKIDSLAVGSLAISPDNSTIYVGTGEGNQGGDNYAGIGLLKSTDEGKTWTVLGANYFTETSISSIAIRPSNPNDILVTNTIGVYAKGFAYNNTASFGIYLSTDGGNTWTLTNDLSSYRGASELLINSSNDNIIYAGTYYGDIWQSPDGGSTWTVYDYYSTTPADQGRVSIAMTPANPKYLYEVFSNSTGEIIWMGTYDGTGYHQFSPTLPVSSNGYGPCNGQCWYDLHLNVDPTNNNTIYVGTNNLYRSTNGGSTWSILGGAQYCDPQTTCNANLHPDMHAFAFAPGNPSTIYSGNDGGIYTSSNAGSSWTSLNTNLGTLQLDTIAASPTNDAHLVAGAQDNACDIYSNSTTWNIAAYGDGAGTAFFSDSAMECNYVQLNPYISSDGVHFSSVTSGLITTSNVQFYAPLAQDPSNSNVVYFGSDRIYKLTYPTLSWTDLAGNTISTGSITSIGVSKTNGQVLLIGDNQGVVKLSINGGTSWNQVFSTNSQYGKTIPVTSVAIDPFNSSILYFSLATTTQNEQLFISYNQGATWNYFYLTGVPRVAVNVVKVNPVTDTPFIGTDRGLYYQNTTGSWNELGSGLPNAAVWDLTFTASNYLVVGTHGRGAWLNYMTPDVNVNVANGTSYKSGNSIIVGITDPNGFTNATYHWDQNTNSTGSNSFSTTIPSLEGQHMLYVYAKDVAGNWVAKKYVFVVDNTAPVITLQSPTNNTKILTQSSVQLAFSDASPIKSLQYNWNGGANTTATVSSNTLSIKAPSTAGQGILQVYATDSAGNVAKTTFVFEITEPTQSTSSSSTSSTTNISPGSTNNQSNISLPGFELAMLVSTLSIAIIRRRRKQMKK